MGLVDQMTTAVFRQSYITQAPVFVYTNQLLCHCVFVCSNFCWWLVYCMRWLSWCFYLLAESYETMNHYHYINHYKHKKEDGRQTTYEEIYTDGEVSYLYKW